MARILIVEDEGAFGDSLAARLRAAGFEVHSVGDGYAAIERLRANRYDVMILDLIIRSGLNGFGVLNFLEMDQPEMLDRVFLVTGMPEQTVVRMAPQVLPRYYRKPVDPAKLVAAIEDFLQPPPVVEPRIDGARVLIVEDDQTSLAATVHLTEEIGYHAETAADGREAIAKLSAAQYDAVVLDLMMPEIDGFSVLEFLRKRHPEMVDCTIIVSGLPERYRQGLIDYKVSAVLEKPIDARRFRDVLQRCVSGRE